MFWDQKVGANVLIINTLKPSGRGERKLTDVNNVYIQADQLTWDVLKGRWTDAGIDPVVVSG